jgi:hypothetical protein
MALGLNFPGNPNVGDIYSFGGTTWIYNGVSWDAKTNFFNRVEITILASDWAGSDTVTKTVMGVTANNLIIIGPGADSYTDFATYQVRATSQGTNSLTFKATVIPVSNIKVNVAFVE